MYLPTESAGPEVEQNRIRLRNLLARSEGMLEDLGWRTRAREEYLAEARELIEGEAFWKRGARGLAVLIGPEGAATRVVLHHPVPERVVVAGSYHVRPLLAGLDPVAAEVLVLTLGRVRLYAMTRHHLERVEADLPDSFQDVNWFVDREPQRQQHPNARGEKSGRHGHDPSQRRLADIERFLGAIDDALPGPRRDGPPLVVLGVDDLVDRFIALRGLPATSPPNSGISDADDLNQVRSKAVPVLEELDRERQEAARDRARSELGRGNGYTGLEAGIEAAVSGRIAELVIHDFAEPVWGRLDESTLELRRSGDQGPGEVDLVDRLAVHCFRHGAEVSVVDRPIDDHEWVAIARF